MSNIQALKTLAENCKGWDSLDKCSKSEGSDEDWSVGACDEEGNFFPVMTIDTDQYDQSGDSVKLAQYYAAANPAAVLEVIKELEDYQQGARAEADAGDGARAELRQLKAENFDVHATLQAAKGEIERLRAENESLRKDSERYRWLRAKSKDFDLMGLHSYYATGLWNALGEQADWSAAIDAAMSKESSHD